ncbi:helix-turn-helix domain-containing protein [Taurinivorans muris]|uniref:Helix-turn-helix domain-containing protein n=1 Tax=Taurinivorans muris TaxID=2787751 RepID=A0ABY5Y2K3_9BACT|nr:helix-turn-helix domain-containing protein [Desulfovibrionaceae bacterium LT0009]
MSNVENELLNWKQACTILSCSRSYFYNLVNTGVLQGLRLGKKQGVRVYKKDCLSYLKKKKI